MSFAEKLSDEYRVYENGTSEGTQDKWYKDGYWYKTDKICSEGLCEFLTSELLKVSSLPSDSYVTYEMGIINDRPGCRSRDFLKDGESFVTLYRMYQLVTGKILDEELRKMNSVDIRIDYTIAFFKEFCKLDLTDYFAKACTLDYIILNEDRHFNNYGIIIDNDGSYRPAPIFDNGMSLLSGNPSYREKFPLENNLRCAICKSFGSYEKSLQYFGKAFTVDIEALRQNLSQYDIDMSLREVKVLLCELEKYQKMALSV